MSLENPVPRTARNAICNHRYTERTANSNGAHLSYLIVEIIKLEKIEISDALPHQAARPGCRPRVRLSAPETICQL